jgi:hypothetical protein
LLWMAPLNNTLTARSTIYAWHFYFFKGTVNGSTFIYFLFFICTKSSALLTTFLLGTLFFTNFFL